MEGKILFFLVIVGLQIAASVYTAGKKKAEAQRLAQKKAAAGGARMQDPAPRHQERPAARSFEPAARPVAARPPAPQRSAAPQRPTHDESPTPTAQLPEGLRKFLEALEQRVEQEEMPEAKPHPKVPPAVRRNLAWESDRPTTVEVSAEAGGEEVGGREIGSEEEGGSLFAARQARNQGTEVASGATLAPGFGGGEQAALVDGPSRVKLPENATDLRQQMIWADVLGPCAAMRGSLHSRRR